MLDTFFYLMDRMGTKEKFVSAYFARNPIIESLTMDENICFIAVIPVKNDFEIHLLLDSLHHSACQANERIGVIIVVNHGADDSDRIKDANHTLVRELEETRQGGQWPMFDLIVKQLETEDKKQKGVGYARKWGMDRAAYYFVQEERNGVIASLDADCFVSRNYVGELIRDFHIRSWKAVVVAVEHRFQELDVFHRDAMICYELSLYYVKLAQRYLGHPYSFITLGSAFAVSALGYLQQGGMNTRQAGEDFYFLQKMIASGGCRELLSVCVYPSARLSFRTPFGTGQAVASIMEDVDSFCVYDFNAYRDLKQILNSLSLLFKCSDNELDTYLLSLSEMRMEPLTELMNFKEMILECNENCSSERQFRKRFFNQFNGFRLLRYFNESHQRYYHRVSLKSAVNAFLTEIGEEVISTNEAALYRLRQLEKSTIWSPITL